MKTTFITLVFLSLGGAYLNARDSIIEHTTAPNGKFAIVESKDTTLGKYFFIERKTGRHLGSVLPSELTGASNVEIETSWQADASKVALLVSYGTKLSAVLVYNRDDRGFFERVSIPDIDPIQTYENGNRHFSREGPGYEENAVGPWINSDVAQIVRGNAKEYEKGTKHFLIILEVKVTDVKGTIIRKEKVGVLSDEESEDFFAKWKKRDGKKGGGKEGREEKRGERMGNRVVSKHSTFELMT